MNNFIVSYDLNGRTPTHAEMDKHIRMGCHQYGRILETVWFIQASSTVEQLFAYLWKIMSPNDRLMVVEGNYAAFMNLLVVDQVVIDAWNGQRAA